MPEPHDYTSPDMASAALVIIDTQVATLDDRPLEIPGTTTALPAMIRLAAAFRQAGKPIVHIVRIYRRDGRNVDLCRRSAVECGAELILEDSDDCQVAAGLLPDGAGPLDCARLLSGKVQTISANEVVIYKPRWGAFYKTPLEAHLADCEVSTLVFAGSNFPNCPRASIYEASERDFRIVAAADALSGLYDRGITELENIGVRFRPVDEIIKKISP
jgi:nicotinamidase-related amidase